MLRSARHAMIAAAAALALASCGGVAWITDPDGDSGPGLDPTSESIAPDDPALGDPVPGDPTPGGADSDGPGDENPFSGDGVDDGGGDVPGGFVCEVGAPERCNYVDDDCDGQIDEGVRDRCDGCDPRACPETTVGVGAAIPFDTPEPEDGVVMSPDGSLTLETSTVTTDFAYPSNDFEGTVSRVDTIAVREVARYPSVVRLTAAGVPCSGATPGCYPEVSDWWTGCNRPSRTTVDRDGSAYVGNRNLVGDLRMCLSRGGPVSEYGSVTKIALYEERFCEGEDLSRCQCIDRNGNGRIDTSRDLDDDGVIEGNASSGSCTGAQCGVACASNSDCASGHHCVIGWCSTTPPKGEFLGYADECLSWTVRLPGDRPVARSMAIDAGGFIWAGDFRNAKVFKIDPSGSVLDPDGPGPATATSGLSVGVHPYGAVTDGLGRMWVLNSSGSGQVQYVATATGALGLPGPEDGNPTRGYGITIDRRNRVWLASYHDTFDDGLTAASSRNGGSIARYDASTDTWTVFGAGLNQATAWTQVGQWGGRGISASGAGTATDGQGIVWASFHRGSAAWLVGLEDDTGRIVHQVNLNATCGAVVNIGVGIGAMGRVWTVNHSTSSMCVYDPVTGDVDSVKIGRHPYTYSDFTGNIFRTFTQPIGEHSVAQLGCDSPYVLRGWESLSWDADAPGTSKVEVLVRVGATMSAAATAIPSLTATTEPTRSLDLRGLPELPYIVIDLRLHAGAPGEAPTVRSLNLLRRCALDE